jgi:hypothetical protein
VESKNEGHERVLPMAYWTAWVSEQVNRDEEVVAF